VDEAVPGVRSRRPAARALARWTGNPERDVHELPQLFEDWQSEVMEGLRSLPESAPAGLRRPRACLPQNPSRDTSRKVGGVDRSGGGRFPRGFADHAAMPMS
jgi:hypothetical protein